MSLIELVIGLLIIGILLAMAAPSYTAWIQNTKIRTTAEAMLNGLQLARAEAVRRNTQIRFQLTDTIDGACALSASSANWIVSFDDPSGLCASGMLNDAADAGDTTANPAPRIIQIRPAAEGSAGVAIAAAVAGTPLASIAFNGLGRVAPTLGADFDIDISNPAAGTCATVGGGGGPMRCMRVTVSPGGQIRMCDPARANTDPVGC